jgi:hypothetical protein
MTQPPSPANGSGQVCDTRGIPFHMPFKGPEREERAFQSIRIPEKVQCRSILMR